MKKSVLAGLLVVPVLAVVSVAYFGKQVGDVGDKDTSAAMALLQKEGYSDIKVLDSHYVTAIPPNHDGVTPLIGAVDSMVVSVQKDGQVLKLRVKDVGRTTMTIEKM